MGRTRNDGSLRGVPGALQLWQQYLFAATLLCGGCTVLFDTASEPLPIDEVEDSFAWRRLETSGPPTLAAHRMAYDRDRGRTVMFGGYNGNSVVAQHWEFANGAWALVDAGSKPSQQLRFGMVYSASERAIIALLNQSSGETWRLDSSGWDRLTPSSPPPPRRSFSMAFDEERGTVLMFGGANGSSCRNDTWEYRNGDWHQMSPATRPPPRRDAAMAYAGDGRLLLFGGNDCSETPSNSATVYGDTWEWDGSDWTRMTPTTFPPSRATAAMTRHRDVGVILFGGHRWDDLPCDGDSPLCGDTWRWTGTDWQQLHYSQVPPPRRLHSIVFDSARRRLLLYGGFGSDYLSDTWVFSD